MRVHPLLLPHLIEMDPQAYPDIGSLSEAWIENLPGFYGSFGINTTYGVSSFSSIDGYNFKGDVLQTSSIIIKSEKFRKEMFGKGLDLLLDIPLAHTCKITDYWTERRGVEYGNAAFECNMEPVSARDIPRHTPESYKAMIARMGLEVLANEKLDWMSVRIIRHLGARALVEMDFNSLIKDGEPVMGSKTQASHLKLEHFGIEQKSPAFLLVTTRCYTTRGHLRVAQKIPQTILDGITGENFSRIVETPLLQDIKVKGYKTNIEETLFEIEEPEEEKRIVAAQSAGKLLPDIFHEAILIAKEQEEDKTPNDLKEYRSWLREIDTKRDTSEETNLLTCHLHRRLNGTWHNQRSE